jgi:hypothetical protein
MKPEISVQCSDEPDESNPHTAFVFSFKIHSYVILPFTPRSTKWQAYLSFSFPTEILCASLLLLMRATCPAHILFIW